MDGRHQQQYQQSQSHSHTHAPPPPPPPPHGAHNTNHNANAGPNPGSASSGGRSGLPDGNYDIFIIPPHSSGSGFLYLPSLQPHRNSFFAGVASTVAVGCVWVVIMPVLKQWVYSFADSGGTAMLLLALGVGVVGWIVGKLQFDGQNKFSSNNSGGAGAQSTPQPGHPPQTNPGPGAGSSPNYNYGFQGPSFGASTGPSPSTTPSGGPSGTAPKPRAWGTANGTSASESWAKAREETRKREEERKAKEEREKKVQEMKETLERMKQEKAKAREREQREKEARERIAQERLQKEAAAAQKPPPIVPTPQPTPPPSPQKTYKKPTAQSFAGDDEDSYRFERNHKRKPVGSTSSFSEASWAGTQSTACTTPPPSQRGPYSTSDPDKVQIKAVYMFNDLFVKPVAQLIAGTGLVTDGLILKMTTEGLFIDDDVRGVGQREWDVKAWTLKLMEVWCPTFVSASGTPTSTPARYALKQKDPRTRFFAAANTGNVVIGSSSGKNALSAEEIDLILTDLLRTCQAGCSLSQTKSHAGSSHSMDGSSLHVLRATTRDANNKRYVFVLSASEAWKVAVGLQTLRRGSQLRSMGVGGMSNAEATRVLTSLGHG